MKQRRTLLFADRLHGWRVPLRRPDPGGQWGLLRDNGGRRSEHLSRRPSDKTVLWNDLQNHREWRADDAIHLLRRERVQRRREPLHWAGPGRQRGFLRDYDQWRGQRPGRDGLQDHPKRHVADAVQFLRRKRLPDGDAPNGLVQAVSGDIYGTTAGGGSNASKCSDCGGTVFKIAPSGALTTLYNFCTQDECADGATPNASLVQGTDGSFYGTTVHGGANLVGGTVFKITAGGALTTLYSFCSVGAHRVRRRLRSRRTDSGD